MATWASRAIHLSLGKHVSRDGLSDGAIRVWVEACDVDPEGVADETYELQLGSSLRVGAQQFQNPLSLFGVEQAFSSSVEEGEKRFSIERSFFVGFLIQKVVERSRLFFGDEGKNVLESASIPEVFPATSVHGSFLSLCGIAAAILLFFLGIVNWILLMYNSLT